MSGAGNIVALCSKSFPLLHQQDARAGQVVAGLGINRLLNNVTTVAVFSASDCALGESPVWDARRLALFWLDISKRRLFLKGIDGKERVWNLPWIASAIFLPEGEFDGVILATEAGLMSFGLSSGSAKVLARTGAEAPHMRTNDGGTDPSGRVWFGTMAKEGNKALGAVYSWSRDEGMRKMLDGVSIPNTFVWSKDSRTLVMADSSSRRLDRYSFDVATGTVQLEGSLIDFATENTEPDGSAIDVDDTFWNAQWDGGRLVRITLAGAVLSEIAVPCPRPTSCCFGGPDMRTLYITSAAMGVDKKAYPASGSVFQIEVPVAGREVARVGGVGADGEVV